jgi:hypothetical protein
MKTRRAQANVPAFWASSLTWTHTHPTTTPPLVFAVRLYWGGGCQLLNWCPTRGEENLHQAPLALALGRPRGPVQPRSRPSRSQVPPCPHAALTLSLATFVCLFVCFTRCFCDSAIPHPTLTHTHPLGSPHCPLRPQLLLQQWSCDDGLFVRVIKHLVLSPIGAGAGMSRRGHVRVQRGQQAWGSVGPRGRCCLPPFVLGRHGCVCVLLARLRDAAPTGLGARGPHQRSAHPWHHHRGVGSEKLHAMRELRGMLRCLCGVVALCVACATLCSVCVCVCPVGSWLTSRAPQVF